MLAYILDANRYREDLPSGDDDDDDDDDDDMPYSHEVPCITIIVARINEYIYHILYILSIHDDHFSYNQVDGPSSLPLLLSRVRSNGLGVLYNGG